jgi:histone H3/H4
MEDELISAGELARDLGIRKDSVLRIMRRLHIDPKMRTTPSSNGKQAAHITLHDAERIRDQLPARARTTDGAEAGSQQIFAQNGTFYLFQLEPDLDPGRFKVGFTDRNIKERERDHKCVAPFIRLIQTWSCKRRWEKTAIDAVTKRCEKLHTEVFRADSIDEVIERCREFFDQMSQ